MKIKVSTASEVVLDWLVAKAEGLVPAGQTFSPFYNEYTFHPSTDWSQGGPIIEREGIDVIRDLSGWVSLIIATIDHPHIRSRGPTPLIAAMRCFVASKLGNEVEIPDGLAVYA